MRYLKSQKLLRANIRRVLDGDLPSWIYGIMSAGFSVLALVIASLFFDPCHFHIYGLDGRLNDTSEYVGTARWIAENGTFRHQTVIASYAYNPSFRYYMPGYYVLMAISFRLFGYGAWQSVLPSAGGYVLTVILICLLTRRLVSSKAGLLVSAAYALFPAHLVFSMTAMMESTFIGASILSIYLSSTVPIRWLSVMTPLFVAIPFMVRETGFLMVVFPVLRLSVAGVWRYRWAIVSALGTSIIFLRGLYSWWYRFNGIDINANAWLATGGFNYDDAMVTISGGTSYAEYATLIFIRIQSNLTEFAKTLTSPHILFPFYYIVFFSLLFCAIAVSKSRWKLGCSIPAATVTAVSLTSLATLAFYTMSGYTGMRMLIHLVPMLFVSGALALSRLTSIAKGRHLALAAMASAVAMIYLLLSLQKVYAISVEVLRNDTQAKEEIKMLKKINLPSGDGLLLSPVYLGLAYVVESYPRRWSFIPANQGTLELLERNFGVDAIVIEKYSPKEGLLERKSYQARYELQFNGKPYLIWINSASGNQQMSSRPSP